MNEVGDNVAVKLVGISRVYKLRKFRQKTQALSDINLSINRGEFIAITGASGSGKSTLLQLIGLLDKPTTGQVIINGVTTNSLGDGKSSQLRNNQLGFVFQSFYLQPFLSVLDNIMVPAMFDGETTKSIRPRAMELLDYLGLADKAKSLPGELSGGQSQRVAIARALINQPSIILADEPTGNLDSKNSQSVVDILRSFNQELGTTVIIVTHDQQIATQADRIVHISDGRIIWYELARLLNWLMLKQNHIAF